MKLDVYLIQTSWTHLDYRTAEYKRWNRIDTEREFEHGEILPNYDSESKSN